MENLVELKNIYKDKKVFLTGHTGFKGSWMLQLLAVLGAEVKGFALETKTTNDLYNLLEGDKLCKSIIGDIRDRNLLIKEILDFEPDFIFHLAAQPLVRLSYEIPAETFEVNAIGTANVLDAVRQLNKKCHTVLITTDKVYHNNEWIYPYRENDRLGGYDPYSASKACTELIIDSYRNSFFNLNEMTDHKKSIAVGRAGNVIGGGDWSEDRLIPDIAKGLIANSPVSIRNPSSVRPWQHVLEPVSAYLVLGACLSKDPVKFSQAYNFGPNEGDSLSVEQMVNLAIKYWGSGDFDFVRNIQQPHEAGLLKLDISKAISELKWSPKLNAGSAVELTMKWYQQFHMNRKNIKDFTMMQVLQFLDA
ncbi:CDP-glucose 4,6-dehydratase [Pedobacter sp. MC2016-15]|uniref:CDP-glucose 4,6-dehydratase n=1 Tax=Pedobacter sp. MC2016-15 TaxID=2994473 RepID=UPI0022466A65|nr:CDP-glucose 4,6-dehydratase [Pedobacter sp. MC2016-15]MCX2481797.1 CDP-glucose 4,6-dehydratase [Pedobacter sp. MC2016-15]